MDISTEIFAHETVADECGIAGTNRLMIEAAPFLDVPNELRAIAVPSLEDVWRMLMVTSRRPYPFIPEAVLTWETFMNAV